jgi:choice-of-anchor A domain-containing protein
VKNIASLIAATALLSTAGLASASTLTLGAASGYNAFVLGNFTESGTDSIGAIAVGGNFAPAANGSFTIASGHGGDNAAIYDLVVAGNFTDNSASLGGGSAFVGGNLTWNDPTLPHNVYVDGNFSNPSGGGSVGGTVYYGGTYSSGDTLSNSRMASAQADPVDFLGAQTNLTSVSATLASATANGTVSSAYNTYTLTGTNSSINVFNLTGGSYSNSTMNITAPAGSTVIINVAGTSDSFSGGSINLNGVSANDVIWNFSSATAISVGSIAFNGTLLAPGASFTGTYGQLNGQLIVDNAAGTTELHDVLFNGALPSSGSTSDQSGIASTPEPGTWVLLVAGVVLIAIARRRATGKGSGKSSDSRTI